MARVEQADRSQLPPEFQERFDIVETSNGYIPNSYLILAHRPPILQAFMDLSKAVIRDEGTLDRGLSGIEHGETLLRGNRAWVRGLLAVEEPQRRFPGAPCDAAVFVAQTRRSGSEAPRQLG